MPRRKGLGGRPLVSQQSNPAGLRQFSPLNVAAQGVCPTDSAGVSLWITAERNEKSFIGEDVPLYPKLLYQNSLR
jgi:hypothetical protein